MDGFETAAQIKRRGRTPNVPIIFLTAAGSSELELAFRGYAAGAVDYISKPFDPWVLRAKVSVFVDLYLKDRVVSDLAPLLSAIEDAAAGLARLPAALTSGALADGLAQLDGAIAALRSRLGSPGISVVPGIEGMGSVEG
jgi:PleD family two-component response regulator